MLKRFEFIEIPPCNITIYDRTTPDYIADYENLNEKGKKAIRRGDIASVQFPRVANVFFHVNGRAQIEFWPNVMADQSDKNEIEGIARKLFESSISKEFIERHIECYSSYPTILFV